MRTSDSIVNISKSLLKFNGLIGNISKDAVNPFHKSKYASLTSILDGISGPLNSSGLVVMQSPSNDGDSICLVTTVIHAETGEFIESIFSINPIKKDPQGIGSCITYMRRYSLVSILMLNSEDDDGNLASNVAVANKKVLPSFGSKDFDNACKQLSDAEDFDSLRRTYLNIVKSVKSSFLDSDVAIDKISIVKDDLKSKFN